jgi:hypothetical protein
MAIGREDYEDRKAERINRYEERAAAARGEASSRRGRAKSISDGIPLGQPILVGHHSEARARADMNKIHTAMSKAKEADEKAGYYEGKAEAAGKNRAISGDNPEAVNLYRKKLEKLEAAQEKMKAVNKACRQGDGALKALGMDEDRIAALKDGITKSHPWDDKPYPAWALSNNNAEIRRIKEKIAELSRLDSMNDEDITFNGGKLVFNMGINRVQFIFDSIPGVEVRTLLKKNGYKWSRREGAWQRQRTVEGVANAKRMLREIKELEEK